MRKLLESIPLVSFAFVLAGLTPIVAHASPGLRTSLLFSQEEKTGPADQDDSEGGSATVLELSAELRHWLEQVRELRTQGDLDGARTQLSALTSSEEYAALLAGADDVALVGLRTIDGAAEVLGLVKIQGEVREEQVRRMSASLNVDHPDLLSAMQNLAATRSTLGDLAGASELFERVHEVRDRLLPADHPALLAAKQDLAATHFEMGDLPVASELFERVHEARERLLPVDHPDLLAAKQDLAETRYAMGDLAGARELFELVHEARERLLPADHPDLLAAKQNLAAMRSAMGDLAGARELFELVHEARERLLPADHPDLLAAKQNLAATRSAMGDLAGARELEELVHEAQERLLPADHPDLLTAKEILAATRSALGDVAGARQLISTVLRGQIQRATALRRDAPRIARAAAAGELQRLSSCLFLDHSPDSENATNLGEELFAALEALRSVSVGAGGVQRAAGRRPELAGLLGTLKRVRGDLSQHRLGAPSGGDDVEAAEIDAWRQELIRLVEERAALEQRARTALAEGEFVSPWPTAKSVAAGLPPGGVLINYLRYEKFVERDSKTGIQSPSINSLLAFVVTLEGEVTRVELGAGEELEHLVMQWRELIGKPIERGSTTALKGTSEIEVGAKLRARLIDPCLAVLGDTLPTELYIIPDDFLHTVPMDALPWTDGRRLGDEFGVRLEASAQRLADRAAPFEGEGILLAMGGVDFAAKDVVDATPPSLTVALPTSESYRLEVELLGLMHKELTGGDSVVLTKADASKKALVERATSARYLHVATHGWFANVKFDSTLDGFEQQNRDVFGTLSRAADMVLLFAPDSLCGLALAGADHGVDSAGRIQGIITAGELGALDLSGCELAVLSASETNAGLYRAGQGIQSLAMALHTAGARTAITSLWRVDRTATTRLMELFYTNLWSEQLGKADALWQAKMALREEGFGVKDWAAWVLTGDPR